MPLSLGTNAETLLVLAWGARQPGLRKALVEANERGHKSELALRSWLTGALPFVFEEDPVYGPAYQRLFLHRLEQVEWSCASWALRGLHSTFLKEGEEADAAGEDAEAGARSSEETALLWEAITQGERLTGRLKRLSRDWAGNVPRGARLLRLHFLIHLPLLVRTTECPFLVQELLVMSLERVNWRELAAQLLGVPYLPQPTPESAGEDGEDEVMCFATLLELIWSAHRDIGEYVLEPKFSRQVRDLCAEVQDRCFQAHGKLRTLWEGDGSVFHTETGG